MQRSKTRGVSEKSEEDFFASSPTANLVGIIEEGHERFAERLQKSIVLCNLFLSLKLFFKS